MKGTRTYQIAIIAALLLISGVINFASMGFSMKDLSSVTSDATEFLDVGGKFYLAFLIFWKMVKPHPMKHEK